MNTKKRLHAHSFIYIAEASISACNGGICTNMVVCFGPWWYPEYYNLYAYPDEEHVSCVHDRGVEDNGCVTFVCGVF